MSTTLDDAADLVKRATHKLRVQIAAPSSTEADLKHTEECLIQAVEVLLSAMLEEGEEP